MSMPDFPETHKGLNDNAIALPHNIDAEQAVLGTMLMDNKLFEEIADLVDRDTFYDPLHGALFDQIVAKIEQGHLANPITLKSVVDTWPAIHLNLEVWQYLGTLVSCATSRYNIRSYAQTLIDLADRRRVIGLAQDLLSSAFNAPSDVSTSMIIEEAERGLFDIAAKRTEGREIEIDGAVTQALDAMLAAHERGGSLHGVPTGLADLDAKLGGFQNSDLIILGGRPAMGKTALATTIAFNIAKEKPDNDGVLQRGGHVHMFSMEMSAQQLAMRLISDQAEISSDLLRRGKINEAEMRHAIERAKAVANASMTVDETGGISMSALAAKARRTKRKKNTKLIVIDYLQLMSGAGKGNDNRVQEITKLTMGLKALAKELDVPIVALSQLSRKVEERADKRPQLSDLRESGSIEQDADVVMFVYRDEYYVEREKPDEFETAKYADWQTRMERSYGKAEVIVGKQRHGAIGTVMLSFQSRFTRFANLAPEKRHAS